MVPTPIRYLLPTRTSFPPTGLSYESTPFSHSLPVSLPISLSLSSKLTLTHTLLRRARDARGAREALASS